jgi:hypothetical protein
LSQTQASHRGRPRSILGHSMWYVLWGKKKTLGQCFLTVLPFSAVSIIPSMFQTHLFVHHRSYKLKRCRHS